MRKRRSDYASADAESDYFFFFSSLAGAAFASEAGAAEADEEQHGDPVHLSRSRDAQTPERLRIR